MRKKKFNSKKGDILWLSKYEKELFAVTRKLNSFSVFNKTKIVSFNYCFSGLPNMYILNKSYTHPGACSSFKIKSDDVVTLTGKIKFSFCFFLCKLKGFWQIFESSIQPTKKTSSYFSYCMLMMVLKMDAILLRVDT